MTETRTIVVATDLSAAARSAIAQACRIAGQVGAEAHAVAVVDRDDVRGLSRAAGVPYEEAERRVLQGVSGRLNEEIEAVGGTHTVRRHAAVGPATEEIVGACERLGAMLLVMGYNGWGEEPGGPGRVAASSARRAPCDVLLARSGQSGAFTRIAVAVDFSEGSLLACERAAEIAGRDGSELALLHAHWNPYGSPMLEGNPLVALVKYEEHAAALRVELAKIAEGLSTRVPGGVRWELLDDVNAARGIAGWCHTNHADLTVLGAVGRSALRHALLGSTADRVLSRTRSAVLVVRAG